MLRWRNTLLEILLILLLGTISLSWFTPGKIIVGTDTVVPQRLSTVDEYFYVWSGRVAPGSIDVNKLAFLFPIGIILKGWSVLGLPYSPEVYERLLVYILFSGAGISVYLLYRTLFSNSTGWGRIASAVFAMFNFYVLFIFTPMPLTLLFSYCFFPTVMAVFVNFLRLPSVRSALFFVLVWSLLLTPSYTTPPYLILHVFILFTYFLFFLLSERPGGKRRLALLCVFSLIVWSLIEAFWLVSLVTNIRYEATAYVGSAQTDRDNLLILNSATLYDAFRLMGYFGLVSTFESSRFYPWYEIYRTPVFIMLTFMIPIIAFSGFLSGRRERSYLFFAFMALLFIFFIKGPYEPYGGANLFIFRQFDLSVIFRTAYQRFTGFTALAFAVMMAYTLERVFVRLWRRGFLGRLTISFIFFVFVVVVPAAVAFPIWTGRLFQSEGVLPSQRIKIPDEYFEVAGWLAKDPGEFNIFPIPFNGGGQSLFWWNEGKDGYGAIYPFESIINKGFVISSVNGGVPLKAASSLIRGSPESVSLLGLLNVRYVLYHRDSNWKMVNHHGGWVSADPMLIDNSLRSLEGLSLVRRFPSIDVYAVKDRYFLPRFYTPTAIAESSLGQGEASVRSVYFPIEENASAIEIKRWFQSNPLAGLPVIFEKVDQTKYKVEVAKARTPFLLVFSDTFDHGWQLSSGEYKAGADHVRVNGYANAWFIDPKVICSQRGICQRNHDGSYDLKAAVEFVPQRTFWKSLVVSLFALVAVLVYLIFTGLRSLRSDIVEAIDSRESTSRERGHLYRPETNFFPVHVRPRLRDPYLAALLFLAFLLLKISSVWPDWFLPFAYIILFVSFITLIDFGQAGLSGFNVKEFLKSSFFLVLPLFVWFLIMKNYPPAPDASLISLGSLAMFVIMKSLLKVSSRIWVLVALIMLVLTAYYVSIQWPFVATATAGVSLSLMAGVVIFELFLAFSHPLQERNL